jgi:hypothetical protein
MMSIHSHSLKSLVFAAVLLALATACSDDAQNQPEPTPPVANPSELAGVGTQSPTEIAADSTAPAVAPADQQQVIMIAEPTPEDLTTAELRAARDRLSQYAQLLEQPLTRVERHQLLMQHLTDLALHQQHIRQMVLETDCSDAQASTCLRAMQKAQIEMLTQLSQLTKHLQLTR